MRAQDTIKPVLILRTFRLFKVSIETLQYKEKFIINQFFFKNTIYLWAPRKIRFSNTYAHEKASEIKF